MNALELFAATGTASSNESIGSPHWPHLNATGTMIQIPRSECDLAGMDSSLVPEAARLVKRIQDGLGTTIGQIAKALDCSRQAVHGWMRGKRVDAVNLANLVAFAEMADEWARSGKDRPSSLSWTDALLRDLADAGLSTEKGRRRWERFVEAQDESRRRRSRVPVGAALDALLGSGPSDALEQAHRLSDNLRSLKRHGR
jgi:hypothetical protein